MQSTYTSPSSKTTASNQSSSLIDSLSQQMQQLGSALVRFLAPDDSIRVRQGQRQGQPIWIVYDRYTNQQLEFASEQDVRNWLDT
jgi:hypothetical protein